VLSPHQRFVGFESGLSWDINDGKMSVGPTGGIMQQVGEPRNTTGNAGAKLSF